MSVAALFASLSSEERQFMLAPAGVVEPRLTPAALAAAAVWTTRETGSVATLEALCPGGAYMVAPGELPGDACNVDMSHLLVPFSSLNGRILGHASTLTRFFCKPGSRTSDAAQAAGAAWQPPVYGGRGAPPPPELGPGALGMNGRFMYDEDARLLLLRTILGGNPTWFGYAFGPHEGVCSSSDGAATASTADSADSWDEARADAARRGKSVTDAVIEAARCLGLGTADRMRSVTMYFPGAELTSDGVANQFMMGDEKVTSWSESGLGVGGLALMDESGPAGDPFNYDVGDTLPPAATPPRRSCGVRRSTTGSDDCSTASDTSSSTESSSAASTMTVVSAAGVTSGGGDAHPPTWQGGHRLAGGEVRPPAPRRARSRRPRTSVIDFSNFAASLSANVTGVYRHGLSPAIPGDLSSYYGSEGVVPAAAVLPIFGVAPGPRGHTAVVGGADWGIAGGGDARLDGLQAAFSSLALSSTPLVRDAERLRRLPPARAGDRGAGWRREGGAADRRKPSFRGAAAGSVTATGGQTAGEPVAATAATAAKEDANVDAALATTSDSAASGSVPSSAAVAPFAALFDAATDGDGDGGSRSPSLPSAEAVKQFSTLF